MEFCAQESISDSGEWLSKSWDRFRAQAWVQNSGILSTLLTLLRGDARAKQQWRRMSAISVEICAKAVWGVPVFFKIDRTLWKCCQRTRYLNGIGFGRVRSCSSSASSMLRRWQHEVLRYRHYWSCWCVCGFSQLVPYIWSWPIPFIYLVRLLVVAFAMLQRRLRAFVLNLYDFQGERTRWRPSAISPRLLVSRLFLQCLDLNDLNTTKTNAFFIQPIMKRIQKFYFQ